MRRSFYEKCRWAKKAAMLDVDTDSGYKTFYKIAKESGLGERRLSYYSNAYEAAGESGIKALSYRKKLPSEVLMKAMKKLNKYLFDRFPADIRKEIGSLVMAKGNRITVFEKRPLFNDPSQSSCIEVFQVRHTCFDNRWHLYWMRKFKKWWPYVSEKAVYTIEDCIREVDKDSWGCFWG